MTWTAGDGLGGYESGNSTKFGWQGHASLRFKDSNLPLASARRVIRADISSAHFERMSGVKMAPMSFR